jgi:hypothetical protein
MSTKTRRYWLNAHTTAAFAALFGMAMLSGCSGAAPNQAQSQNKANAVHEQPANGTAAGKVNWEVPASIAAEHRELHEQLETAIKSGGKTGEAAKLVEEHLSKHFTSEEEFALPQLGLLPALAAGNATPDMRRAIELSDKLKAEMPKMLAEHQDIVKALTALKEAAKAENKPQAIQFAETLTAHAQNEEQVSYPTAILVGEYLKLRLKP